MVLLSGPHTKEGSASMKMCDGGAGGSDVPCPPPLHPSFSVSLLLSVCVWFLSPGRGLWPRPQRTNTRLPRRAKQGIENLNANANANRRKKRMTTTTQPRHARTRPDRGRGSGGQQTNTKTHTRLVGSIIYKKSHTPCRLDYMPLAPHQARSGTAAAAVAAAAAPPPPLYWREVRRTGRRRTGKSGAENV